MTQVIRCCVCMAIMERGWEAPSAPASAVTLYEGSAYCVYHLPHISEAVAAIRRAEREAELERKTVA